MKKQKIGNRRFVLGITGSFGSGKSTVAKMLKGSSVSVVDADRIAHKVLNDRLIRGRISSIFGREVIKKGSVERSRLGALVFRDSDLRLRLQRIVHPRIIRIIKEEIKNSRHRDIILDAPLLIEAGLQGLADKLLVVTISREEQLKRLLRKTHLKKADILKRMRAQYPLSRKVRMADFIIDNSGRLEETEEQVKKIRRLLWKK